MVNDTVVEMTQFYHRLDVPHLRRHLSRPQPEQVKHIIALYESELAPYRKDKEAALALATDPLGPLPPGMDAAELAAWTVVSNVLLNLDSVLTKG